MSSSSKMRVLFPLAGGAVERAALALQSPDRLAALGRTGLSGFVVDAMLFPVVPLGPVRRQKIPDAGAAGLDRFREDFLHAVVQPLDRGKLQPACRPIGMEPGAVQDFIRIDVDDAGDRLLVHEQRLKPTPQLY